MNCKYCASPLEPGSKFCEECGRPVEQEFTQIYCQRCGEPLAADFGFCTNCGAGVEVAADATYEEKTMYMPNPVVPPVEEPAAGAFCPNCGAAMQPGDAFCVMCGANFAYPMAAEPVVASPTVRKKSNRVLTVILIVLLVLVVAISAFIGYEMIAGSEDEDDDETTSAEEKDEPRKDRPSEEDEEEQEEASDTKKLYVTILHEDGTADYCQLETQEDSLVEAMQQEDLAQFDKVDGNEVPVSVLDEEADLEQDESWIVYQNGDEVEDISDCKIEDGDEIKFVFQTAQADGTELKTLVGTSLTLAQRELMNLPGQETPDVEKESEKYRFTYEDGEILLYFCGEEVVHMVSMSGELPHTIEGLTIGVAQEQADEHLRDEGYFAMQSSEDVVYWESGDGYLVLADDGELLSVISFGEAGDYDENGCTICGTAEEETMDGEYLLPESNSRYLTIDDIDHLDREHLCFARNEIYARHGWIFSVPQIADFFAEKSWYVGTTLPANFNYGVLNEYEQANVKLIVDYEAQFGGSYY